MTTLDIQEQGTVRTNSGDVPDAAVATNTNWNIFATNYDITFQDRSSNNTSSRTPKTFFSGVLKNTSDAHLYDPRVIYDHDEDRFTILYLVIEVSNDDGYFVLSSSSSADPEDFWRQVRFDLVEDKWPDFPGLGIDDDYIYMTANLDRFNSNSENNILITVDKNGMYSSNSVKSSRNLNFAYDYDGDGNELLKDVFPCHNYDVNNNKAFLIHARQSGGDSILVIEVDDPLNTGATTYHEVTGAWNFSATPCEAEQPDDDQIGGIFPDIPSFSNRGIIPENGDNIHCVHTIGADFDNDGDDETAIRYYDIDIDNFSINDQQQWGLNDGGYLCHPSIQYDEHDGWVVPYVRTDSDQNPTMGMAGQKVGDSKSYQVISSGESPFSNPYSEDANCPGTNAYRNDYGHYTAIAADAGTYSKFTTYGMATENSTNDNTWKMDYAEVKLK